MNLYTLSNPADWDRAQWYGTLFGFDPSGKGPPMMGLMFRDNNAGCDVFRSMRTHVGTSDKAGLIRVSIVEGDIEGQDPGYSVVIGLEQDKAFSMDKGSGNRYVAYMSRCHRMNPAPGSPHLPKFKEEFRKHGQFRFVPVGGSASSPRPVMELAIEKYSVHLRHADELTQQDPDHCVLGKPWVSPPERPQ